MLIIIPSITRTDSERKPRFPRSYWCETVECEWGNEPKTTNLWRKMQKLAGLWQNPQGLTWLPVIKWYNWSKSRPHFPSSLFPFWWGWKEIQQIVIQCFLYCHSVSTWRVSDSSMVNRPAPVSGWRRILRRQDVCLGFRLSACAAGCLSGSQSAADLSSILTASRQLTAPQCPISTTFSPGSRVAQSWNPFKTETLHTTQQHFSLSLNVYMRLSCTLSYVVN